MSLYTGSTARTFVIDGTPKNIKGEFLQYTFPFKVGIKSYTLEYMEDSFPVRWHLLAKTPRGDWTQLDDPSFLAGDGYSLDPAFDTTGYSKTFDSVYFTDTVALVIDISTDTSVKIKQFLVYDELGINRQFVIPFCTSTNSLYHTGSLNFSQIDKFSIDSDLKTDFFAVNHNFLVVENGMGDVMYR